MIRKFIKPCGAFAPNQIKLSKAFLSISVSPRNLVLGIETSCDDTGLALVDSTGHVLWEALSSQWDQIHSGYGGIVPHLAAREHKSNLPVLLQRLQDDVGCEWHEQVSHVALTTGPGLSPCLWAGANFAARLCSGVLGLPRALPLLPINHLHAHVLSARLEAEVAFPFVALVVSGGHTVLFLVQSASRFSLVGTTIDDAIGEAYDKVARMLGLIDRHTEEHPLSATPPGGVLVEQAAELATRSSRFELGEPLMKRKDCDFSYSGLKTNVRRMIAQPSPCVGGGDFLSDREAVNDLAMCFQKAAVGHLKRRTRRAVKICRQHCRPHWDEIRHLVVCGGVASNRFVRSELEKLGTDMDVAVHFPAPKLCTDNGVMIAWTAQELLADLGHDRWAVTEFQVGTKSPIPQSHVRPRWLPEETVPAPPFLQL